MQFDAKEPSHLSDSYWYHLSQAEQALHLLVNPMPYAAYTVDWPLKSPAEVVSEWAQCGIGRYPNADLGGFRSFNEIDKATALML